MASTAELGILIKAQDQFSSVMKTATVAAVALGTAFLASAAMALKAAAQEEVGMKQLQRAAENTGVAWDKLGRSVEANVTAWQNMSGVADDEIRPAFALLIAQTGSLEKATLRMPTALDLARGANMDLGAASRLLGKLTDENVKVFARLGLTFKEGATEMEVLRAVQEKFGGQSAGFASTAVGQWSVLQNKFGDIVETLGGLLMPTATVVLTWIGKKVDEFVAGPLPAMIDRLKLTTGAFLEMLGVVTGRSPEAGAALREIAGDEGAEKIMKVLAAIRDFVKDKAIPAFLDLRDKVGEVIDASVSKFEGFRDVVKKVTGQTIDLTDALIALGIVMAAHQIIGFIATIWLAVGAFKAWTVAVGLGEVALIGLKLQIALFIAVGVLVVAALLQIKETVDLVRDNWDKFVFALKSGKLNDIPVFGFFFEKVSVLLAAIETIRNAWDGLRRLLGQDVAVRQPTFGATGKTFDEIVASQRLAQSGLESLRPPAPLQGTGAVSIVGGVPLDEFGTPIFQHGGVMPWTGYAHLEKGEIVSRPGQGGGVTINVIFSGNVYGMADFEDRVAEVVRDRARGGGFRGILAVAPAR